MAIISRLHNPTPFEVRWNWDKGVDIVIKSDGFYDLTNAQMVDFTPNQPGSEAVQQLMAELGIFVRDPDLTYESQALAALRACIKLKESQYNDSTQTIRSRRAEKGIVDAPEALEETFRQLGLVDLRERVSALKVRAAKYEKAVASQKTSTAKQKVDLSRTLIFTNPPKVFETPFAMEVYLDEHPDMRAKYQAFMAAQNQEG